jgi:dTMP kinase
LSTISPGLFISFEGTDGSGKSTQLKLLAERLRKQGHTVLESVEPGGTPAGQQIRKILLDPVNQDLLPMTELLLMFASRAQAVGQWIVPALNRGEIVLSDRFTDSSLAYQGEGRRLGFETVQALHRLAIGTLMPDLTICIEIDLETSLARAHGRNRSALSGSTKETRLDEQSIDFHRRVQNGYARIALEEPHRFKVVNGAAPPTVVAETVWKMIEPLASARFSATKHINS